MWWWGGEAGDDEAAVRNLFFGAADGSTGADDEEGPACDGEDMTMSGTERTGGLGMWDESLQGVDGAV